MAPSIISSGRTAKWWKSAALEAVSEPSYSLMVLLCWSPDTSSKRVHFAMTNYLLIFTLHLTLYFCLFDSNMDLMELANIYKYVGKTSFALLDCTMPNTSYY